MENLDKTGLTGYANWLAACRTVLLASFMPLLSWDPPPDTIIDPRNHPAEAWLLALVSDLPKLTFASTEPEKSAPLIDALLNLTGNMHQIPMSTFGASMIAAFQLYINTRLEIAISNARLEGMAPACTSDEMFRNLCTDIHARALYANTMLALGRGCDAAFVGSQRHFASYRPNKTIHSQTPCLVKMIMIMDDAGDAGSDTKPLLVIEADGTITRPHGGKADILAHVEWYGPSEEDG
nr:hypothetical protein [Patescibacteria group bacterium]